MRLSGSMGTNESHGARADKVSLEGVSNVGDRAGAALAIME